MTAQKTDKLQEPWLQRASGRSTLPGLVTHKHSPASAAAGCPTAARAAALQPQPALLPRRLLPATGQHAAL
jgi:hypothetical protein